MAGKCHLYWSLGYISWQDLWAGFCAGHCKMWRVKELSCSKRIFLDFSTYWFNCIFIDIFFQVLKTVFAIYVDCWLILTSEQVLSDGICTQRLLTMAAAAPRCYLRLALVAVRFAAQRLHLIDPSLCWVGFLWRLQRAQWAAVGHLWLRRLVVAKHASWLGWVEGLCLLCFYVCLVRMQVSSLLICVLVTGLGILSEECGMFTGDVKSKLQVTLWLSWLRTSNHYVSDRSHMPSLMLIFWIWLYIGA